MSITDQEVLNDIQGRLIEKQNSGASWSSGLWGFDEVIAYANSRQQQFVKESAILLKRATIVTVSQITRHDLPADWIATQRLVWRRDAGTYTEIARSDTWEATNSILDWTFNQVPDHPLLYTDGEAQTLKILTMPAVDATGQLQILYTYLSTTLTGLGVAFTVPDEFVPAIEWGIMADMLSKVGRTWDPIRASYCESRYREGVEAARIMIAGWM